MASSSSTAHLFSFFSPSKPPPPTKAPNQLLYLYVSTDSLPSLSISSKNGLAPVVPTIIDNNPLSSSSSSTSWNELMSVVHPSLAFANTLFFRSAKSDSSSSDDEEEKLSSTSEEKREGGGSSDGNIVGPKFKDLGGMSGVIEELFMEVIVPLFHPQLPRHLGVKPMAGLLLHGPPGCGKTKLAHAIANETGLPFYKTSATELVSVYSGDTEKKIRELFSKAHRTAPSIVFIDEIDAIASKREDLEWEKDRRIVTQLMTCMDNSNRLVQPADGNGNSESSDGQPGNILVIGATNRPDALDPALRRPGRFDREIVLGVPDENARVDILSKLTHKLKVEGAFDPLKIARFTPGFVGADLAALTYKAGNLAMKRICDHRKAELSNQPVDAEHAGEWWRHPWSHEEMEKLSITIADFEEASKLVQPSSTRKGFSSVPNVKWEDVGGLHMLRQEFDRYIVHRIKCPDIYAVSSKFGIFRYT